VKKTKFSKGSTGIMALMAMIILFSSPSYAANKSSKKPKKTVKITQSKRKTTKKKSSGQHPSKGIYYVAPPEENLRKAPSGKRIGSLTRGVTVTVNKTHGNWAYVTVKAWIWRRSLSRSRPRQIGELLVRDVKGTFKKKIFVIRSTLSNDTNVAFSKVALQGELFRGKKRVAYKTVTLFSNKKPLGAGKNYTFSISFKRTKGFDRYSVRILSATEK